jgi:hypothetical protein
MAGKKRQRSEPSLEVAAQRDYWSIPEFARLKCGRTDPWAYKRLTVDATGRRGVIALPDGVDVPVHRDTNGRWVVARHQYELAVARSLAEMKEGA